MPAMCGRMQAQGLKPQFFLPASHLAAITAAASSSKQVNRGKRLKQQKQQRHTADQLSIFAPGVRATLGAFVLEPAELADRLQAVQQQQQQHQDQQQPTSQVPFADRDKTSQLSSSSSSSTTANASEDANEDGSSSNTGAAEAADDVPGGVSRDVYNLGVDMAITTTLVRLLELKLLELEGEEGTGSLDGDEVLLKQHKDGQLRLPDWQYACVVYRAGQKQLVRGYLVHAKQHLQHTLEELQKLTSNAV